jgi:hypothetical protein
MYVQCSAFSLPVWDAQVKVRNTANQSAVSLESPRLIEGDVAGFASSSTSMASFRLQIFLSLSGDN